MAEGGDDEVGLRLGGLVDRTAVSERLAARATRLEPIEVAAPTRTPTRAATRGAAVSAVQAADVVAPSSMRRSTAARLRRSLDTAAHALVVVDVDYGAVDAVRGELQLTYLPFVARATIEAIRAFPNVNGTAVGEALLVSRAVHLGIAVDLGFQGLVVPIVRDAADLRLRALAGAIDERAESARSRRLAVGDFEGGTFTITNVGSYGTVSAAPIINHPQVAILSVDGIRMRPAAVRGPDDEWAIAVRPVGNLSLAFDHRVFDGAYAAAFLHRVRTELQERDWQAER